MGMCFRSSPHLRKTSPQMSSKNTTTKQLRPSEAAQKLGITLQTLRVWDKEGKIQTTRSAGGHRRIPQSEVDRLNGSLLRTKTLVYCRVSTRKQEDNLERQVGRLLEHSLSQGWDVELYKEIGSGLNESRKQLKKLMKRVSDPDVCRVLIEYKDRLSRFGFSLFTDHCLAFGVEVLVLEDSDDKPFEQELAEDIISLVASFSARLYGKRGGKKKKVGGS